MKKWRAENRISHLAQRKAHYQENIEELRGRARNYYNLARKEQRKTDPVVKAYEKASAKRRILKLRNFIQALKVEKGGACTKCRYKEEPRILQFHHLRDKDNNISEMKSMRKIRLEAEKCVLVCPNCHALTHLNHD